MIYFDNPRTVEAIQWKGDNLDECRAFVAASPYHEFGTAQHDVLVVTRLERVPGALGDSDRTTVQPLNWIVKRPFGDIVVMLDEIFQRCYREAGRA